MLKNNTHFALNELTEYNEMRVFTNFFTVRPSDISKGLYS